ncbi:protein kinase [Trypanosoma theileri]|uniref:Protein kinase n=1 Tax=Trypanosoma theileri TaxID=67003 RepID=A0A1X0NYA7_9TRYP|nr:protein kinase [Trypanosoma theileri]ORC89662.1 protein kinase [Trypanosoma theileri]
MTDGLGAPCKRPRNEVNAGEENIGQDDRQSSFSSYSSYSSASQASSYSVSSSMSQASRDEYNNHDEDNLSSKEKEEMRKHYPMFTVEYAQQHKRGSMPFLQTQEQQQRPLLPLLRLRHSTPSSSEMESTRLFLYNEYEFLRELGKGTYAKVVLCRSLRSGEHCALKIFRDENNYREACWDEMAVMKALCTPVVENDHNQQQQQRQLDDDDKNRNNNYYSINEYNQRNEFGVGDMVMPSTMCIGELSASAEYQGRMGRFNVPITHIPHPVHHAIVFPVLGLSLLDILRNIRKGVQVSPISGSNNNNENKNNNNNDRRLSREVVEVVYRGMPIDLLRSVVYQILLFLCHAHRRGIVHTDLKPENVLFESSNTVISSVSVIKRSYYYTSEHSMEENVNGTEKSHNPTDEISNGLSSSSALLSSGIHYTAMSTTVNALLPIMNSVRVIDFGAAEFLSKCRHVSKLDETTPVFYHRIHTTHYRSVEVLLGLGWMASADIWSLGCMIPELLTGECLFMPRDDLEHLALIQQVIGTFNAEEIGKSQEKSTIVSRVFAHGRHFKDFFDPHTMQLAWPPKSHEEVNNTGISTSTTTSRGEAGRQQRKEQNELEKDIHYVLSRATLQQILGPVPLLYDLCQRMLDYDPLRRITAAEALRHPFFTTPV